MSGPPLRRRRPTATLPVANTAQVREQAKLLMADHRRPLIWMLALNGLAALAGLAGPRLLGDIVESVRAGTTTEHIDRLALLLAAALLAQTLLTWWARRSAFGAPRRCSHGCASASWSGSCRCRCPPSSAPAPATW